MRPGGEVGEGTAEDPLVILGVNVAGAGACQCGGPIALVAGHVQDGIGGRSLATFGPALVSLGAASLAELLAELAALGEAVAPDAAVVADTVKARASAFGRGRGRGAVARRAARGLALGPRNWQGACRGTAQKRLALGTQALALGPKQVAGRGNANKRLLLELKRLLHELNRVGSLS